jgi:hypothetical protein
MEITIPRPITRSRANHADTRDDILLIVLGTICQLESYDLLGRIAWNAAISPQGFIRYAWRIMVSLVVIGLGFMIVIVIVSDRGVNDRGHDRGWSPSR